MCIRDRGVSILEDIDFKVEILRNDLINVQYIMNLIGQIELKDKVEQERNRKQIHQLLDRADDEQLRLKADLIRQFLDKVVPTLKEGTDVNEAYYQYEEAEKHKEIEAFAEDKAYPYQLLGHIIEEYEYSGSINKNTIDEGLKNQGGFLARTKTANKIKSFVMETAQKYSSIE